MSDDNKLYIVTETRVYDYWDDWKIVLITKDKQKAEKFLDAINTHKEQINNDKTIEYSLQYELKEYCEEYEEQV